MTMRPRILYIGFNRSYTNATGEVILRVLGAIGDLEYYGPGFTSPVLLEQGIESWIGSNLEYDFIVTDSYVFESDNIVRRKYPFKGDFIRFSEADFGKYASTYRQFFLKYNGKKILIANWDTYSISLEMIDRILSSETFVMDPGVGFHEPLEKIFEQSGVKAEGNDNWYNFVTGNKTAIIAIPHLISSLEFDFSAIYNRNNLFSVIGAPYPERKLAMKLQSTELKIRNFIEKNKWRVRFKFMKTMSEENLTKVRLSYFGLISDSKFCYCSGGPWQYPVRKYFEIPARGAVAIGWPCTGFENLGFKDRENFLIAKSNEQLLDIIQNTNLEDVEIIGNKGRMLIWNNHSDWARAGQLKESLDLILSNDFYGSYWEDGSYKHYRSNL